MTKKVTVAIIAHKLEFKIKIYGSDREKNLPTFKDHDLQTLTN